MPSGNTSDEVSSLPGQPREKRRRFIFGPRLVAKNAVRGSARVTLGAIQETLVGEPAGLPHPYTGSRTVLESVLDVRASGGELDFQTGFEMAVVAGERMGQIDRSLLPER